MVFRHSSQSTQLRPLSLIVEAFISTSQSAQVPGAVDPWTVALTRITKPLGCRGDQWRRRGCLAKGMNPPAISDRSFFIVDPDDQVSSLVRRLSGASGQHETR